MKQYLIDGNNIIHSNPNWKVIFDEDKERAKNLLVQKVVNHFKDSKNKITIFFDGFNFNHSFTNVSYNVSIKHAKNKTADETILITIEKSQNPRNLVVITTDLELQRKAKLWGCKVVSSEEFIEQLDKHENTNLEKPDELSMNEMNEWLRIFNQSENKEDDNRKSKNDFDID